MIVINSKTLSEAYNDLLENLMLGDKVNDTLELTNVVLNIEKPSLEVIHFPYRKISENYLISELKWYWSADNSVETIGKAAKLWYNITDDGQTSNSAYGYILHKKYNYDQLQNVLEVLKNDINSRRAILNISDPQLNKFTTKDLQCTIAIQFLVRNNKLNMTVYMRSNDIVYGLPYDSIYFMSIQDYLANKLNIKIGSYVHHATSMHLYKKDIDKFTNHTQSLTIYEKIKEIIYENKTFK
jgi:thymidylate synthase